MSERIIVIGAGLVGSSMALALHRAGYEVTLLDAQIHTPVKCTETPDLRCSALVPSSIDYLKKLALWPKIQHQRFGVFRHMHIWHEDAPARPLLLNSQQAGKSELGIILENSILQHALDEALFASDCEIIRPIKTEKIIVEADAARIYFYDQTNTLISRRAKLIIAADGAHSWVREHLHFSVKKWPYEQKAIVTFVRHELSHQQTARQVFLASGPLAFLPLHDNTLSTIVWSAQSALAQALMNESDEVFIEKLSQQMAPFLGNITETGPRKAFDLHMQHAQAYIKPRIALIGDAAHTIHPLAGQGLNLGFADAQQLLTVILAAQRQRRDIGAFDTLRKYERTRKTKNLSMLAAIEFCQRGFQGTNPGLSFLLAQGFSWLNQVPVLKKWVIDRASYP